MLRNESVGHYTDAVRRSRWRARGERDLGAPWNHKHSPLSHLHRSLRDDKCAKDHSPRKLRGVLWDSTTSPALVKILVAVLRIEFKERCKAAFLPVRFLLLQKIGLHVPPWENFTSSDISISRKKFLQGTSNTGNSSGKIYRNSGGLLRVSNKTVNISPIMWYMYFQPNVIWIIIYQSVILVILCLCGFLSLKSPNAVICGFLICYSLPFL